MKLQELNLFVQRYGDTIKIYTETEGSIADVYLTAEEAEIMAKHLLYHASEARKRPEVINPKMRSKVIGHDNFDIDLETGVSK